MKHAPTIAGALLGLAFVVFGLNHFLNFIPMPRDAPPPPPEALSFMGALMPTGYMNFIKVFEITGGLLVALPLTRNLGLLFLGPVIVNIVAFHVFLMKDATLGGPAVIGIVVLALFLLWSERRAWAALVRRNPA
jgi:hypothetical protein